jgi:hypothetical protein
MTDTTNPMHDAIRAAYAANTAPACASCDADSALTEHDGIMHLEIRHDDHCPELARRLGNRAARRGRR